LTGSVVATPLFGALRSLDLSYNKISGVDTSAFASLEQLILSYNSFTSMPNLTTVTTLQSLVLSGNPFQNLNAATAIGNVPPSLLQLVLSNCNITGAVDASVSKMVNLLQLDMSYNAITGALPPSISSLTLAQLNLESNSISSVPYMSNMMSLRSLLLGNNNLNTNVTAVLENLPVGIAQLNISTCGLTGSIPPSIGSFFVMQSMDLSNNSIAGEIPSTMSNMVYIKQLNLQLNALSGSMVDLNNVGGLLALNISSNYLNGTLNTIQNCSYIQALDITGNLFTGDLSPLQGKYFMAYLAVTNNIIEGGIPSFIGTEMRYLQYLSLGRNGFEGTFPDSIVQLPYLAYLDVSFNLCDDHSHCYGHPLYNSSIWLRTSSLGASRSRFTTLAENFKRLYLLETK